MYKGVMPHNTKSDAAFEKKQFVVSKTARIW